MAIYFINSFDKQHYYFFKHENKQIFFSKIKTKRNATILKYICRDKFKEYKQNMSLNFFE